MPQLPVAVIGAGFSGTMAALHLSRLLPPGRQVLLCEKSAVFARGLAYATGCPDHLLNVRAANMSAFPDAPEDFSRWLERCGLDDLACIRATPAGVFAARGLYGRYLTELLIGALTGEASPRLLLENDAVVDLAPAPEGFRLTLAAGRVRAVSGVILACGNLRGGRDWTTRYRLDPWDEAPLDGLRADMPVLVVGTGLTMVDAVAALRRRGFPGPVLALSRHGYLPQVHAPAAPWPAPALSEAERLSARLLLRRLRAEAARAAAGSDWRGVIDGLRAGSVALWRGLPEAEQRRFLRHLRSVWDVHRHRMAPPAAEIIAREREAGGLSILRGRVEAVADQAGFALVRIRERGAPTPRDLAVQRILDASGVASVARSDDPLLRRLMQRGLVRPDAHGLGLAAAEDLALIGADGTAGRPLWTLGPLLRGTLWECTAVPDIRGQAAALAATVAARLAAEAAHEKPLARAGEG